jgi:hypothetical protein
VIFKAGDKVVHIHSSGSRRKLGKVVSAEFSMRELACIYKVQWSDGTILPYRHFLLSKVSDEEYAALILLGNDV